MAHRFPPLPWEQEQEQEQDACATNPSRELPEPALFELSLSDDGSVPRDCLLDRTLQEPNVIVSASGRGPGHYFPGSEVVW